MAETIVLDPMEVANNRAELDITAFIDEGGPNWGDAAIEQYLAEAQRGGVPVDFRVPNRQIQIPLVLRDKDGVMFDEIRLQVQAKAALYQREGGWLRRTLPAGTVFADIVGASLTLGGSWLQAHRDVDIDAVLTLEAIPDFYGEEIALTDHAETTAAELIFTEDGILGDYPARVRIEVDEDSGNNQLGLIWAFRSKHYTEADTARLVYEAEDLEPLDTATVTTRAGAVGGDVVRHPDLATGWTPVVGTNIGGTDFLTHTGSYQVMARAYSPDGNAVRLRFAHAVGDLLRPAENRDWRFPGPSNFYIADLGQIRIDPAAVGDHRWQGQIQAKGVTGGEEVDIDEMWFVPLDDGMGRVRVSVDLPQGTVDYVARDEFNQTSGSLSGKTLPVGGTWSGAGDSDDFTLDTTNHVAQRTATSDSAPRVEIAGTGVHSDVTVQADVKTNNSAVGAVNRRQGVIARYVDISNYLAAYIEISDSATVLRIAKVVSGTETVIAQTDIGVANPGGGTSGGVSDGDAGSSYFPRAVADVAYTLKLQVTDTGHCLLWAWPTGGAPSAPVLVADDTVLATGGALDDGKVGLYDYFGALSATRTYDNFAVWAPIAAAPPTDAVVFANQSAQLTHEAILREDPTGTAFAELIGTGDLPRIPPSGLEERPVEVFLKLSRGDLAFLPDSGIDPLSARIHYRPSWLFVPAAS